MISYTKTVTVWHTDVDIRGRMKPGALLRDVEQVSAEHAAANGMDDAFFAGHSLAMLLGMQALRFARVPKCGERLTLTTQTERCRRGTFKRITTVRDEAGREAALVDARWILVDTAAGRILRGPTWQTEDYWQEALPGQLPQVGHDRSAWDLQPAGVRRAEYSLCDANGHINNASYLDIACDALPPESLRRASVTYAALKYSREVPMGEQMDLLRAQNGTGWFVMGRREGKTAFECKLELGAGE